MTTTCSRNHPLTGDNVYRNPTTGKVQCRTCKDKRQTAWRDRNPRRAAGRPAAAPLDPDMVKALRTAHAADPQRGRKETVPS